MDTAFILGVKFDYLNTFICPDYANITKNTLCHNFLYKTAFDICIKNMNMCNYL